MSEQKKWEDSFTRTMNLEMNSVTARADFLVPVDKSLEPFYSVDDIIMIQSQPDVFEGEQGMFLIDGKPFVKIRRKDHLESLQPHIPPVPLGPNVVCKGKVIGVVAPEWIESELKPLSTSGDEK